METGYQRGGKAVRLLGLGVRLGETEHLEQMSLFGEAVESPAMCV